MKVRFLKKIPKVNENFYGAVGGMNPTFFSNQCGLQGSDTGYTYAVLPFNDTLQQKPNKVSSSRYIHPGSHVRGVGVKSPDKHFTGRVQRIVKRSDGSIKFINIIVDKTNKFVSIQADDNLELLVPKAPSQSTSYTIVPTENIHL